MIWYRTITVSAKLVFCILCLWEEYSNPVFTLKPQGPVTKVPTEKTVNHNLTEQITRNQGNHKRSPNQCICNHSIARKVRTMTLKGINSNLPLPPLPPIMAHDLIADPGRPCYSSHFSKGKNKNYKRVEVLWEERTTRISNRLNKKIIKKKLISTHDRTRTDPGRIDGHHSLCPNYVEYKTLCKYVSTST